MGRQPKGCIPLTPFYNLVNLMRGNHTVGGCPSGGGGGETKSPQERYNLIFLKHFYRALFSFFYSVHEFLFLFWGNLVQHFITHCRITIPGMALAGHLITIPVLM